MRRIIIAVMLSLSSVPAWAEADTILINGKILTVDSSFSIQEALAVQDGKIEALGRTADIRKLAGSNPSAASGDPPGTCTTGRGRRLGYFSRT